MDIRIKYQTKDGEIHFCAYESWQMTEGENFLSAMKAFLASHSGDCRNWNE